MNVLLKTGLFIQSVYVKQFDAWPQFDCHVIKRRGHIDPPNACIIGHASVFNKSFASILRQRASLMLDLIFPTG